MKLSPKHERFVAEYLVDLNATQAAIRAGYSEHTARAQGSALVTHPDIKAAIAAAQGKRSLRTEITQDRVLREIASLAFANIADVMDVDDNGNVSVRNLQKLRPRDQRAIESITQVKSERLSADSGVLETVTLKVKMHSKTTALQMLVKHLGMDAPTQHEHKVDLRAVTREQAERELAEALKADPSLASRVAELSEGRREHGKEESNGRDERAARGNGGRKPK